LFIVIWSCSPLLADKAKPTVDGVASKLSCFCGTCPHLVVTQCGCSTADQIKAEVQKKINAGMTESQIVDSFVAEYGQTILTTPPKTGFNLTAWGLPFLGFLVGGTVLFAFLKRQQPPPGPKGPSPSSSEPMTDQDYRERVKKELESRR
jgi:cytochrome c-type biogenesis protein CcmH